MSLLGDTSYTNQNMNLKKKFKSSQSNEYTRTALTDLVVFGIQK
jgi:hypothetical protein